MAAAARVRDAGLVELGRPGTVTYSRKVFIPLIRLCRDRCHYCTFAPVPGATYLSGASSAGRRRRCLASVYGPAFATARKGISRGGPVD